MSVPAHRTCFRGAACLAALVLVTHALRGVSVSATRRLRPTAGQRCTKGYGKNTYGTGCFLLVHTGTEAVRSTAGLLTTVGYKLGPTAAVTFALEGSIAIAGMAVAWLRDQLGLIDSAADIEALASEVPDTGAPCILVCPCCMHAVPKHL